ncbi:MAG TPA: phosphatase PAP2 family protein [Alphaproteobacteria bacterium]|nr:phosphatase PAP2 family protein [Alphaproteobacteria bacterium]
MSRRAFAVFAILVTLICGAALLAWADGIDKWFANLFYDPAQGFGAGFSSLLATLRISTRLSAYGVGAFLIFGFAWRVLLGRAFFALSRAGVIYLMAVFILGPGLLVNSILKEDWGRARPSQIVEFGGEKHYTPPLEIADQCQHNCSFVSGEASLGFAFSAFGFVATDPRRRRLGLAAGIVLGSAFGFLRIAQGGHFLSDVYFAGVFIFALAWALHRILIGSRLLDALGLWRSEHLPNGRA